MYEIVLEVNGWMQRVWKRRRTREKVSESERVRDEEVFTHIHKVTGYFCLMENQKLVLFACAYLSMPSGICTGSGWNSLNELLFPKYYKINFCTFPNTHTHARFCGWIPFSWHFKRENLNSFCHNEQLKHFVWWKYTWTKPRLKPKPKFPVTFVKLLLFAYFMYMWSNQILCLRLK